MNLPSPSADGKTTIHAIEWLPEGDVRAVLQIAHGVSEYAERYAPLAEFLTQRGYAVTANDHIGHGQSLTPGAPIAHFTSADAVVDDMYRLRNLEGKKFPARSYFLLGLFHGLLSSPAPISSATPGTLSGAIVMGTGQMRPAGHLPTARLIAQRDEPPEVRLRSAPVDVVNQLSFDKYNRIFKPTRTEYDWLSADPEERGRLHRRSRCARGSASVATVPGDAAGHAGSAAPPGAGENGPRPAGALRRRGTGPRGGLRPGRPAGL
jgi:alpha-beta hydrolase superfamily lysophospholipase